MRPPGEDAARNLGKIIWDMWMIALAIASLGMVAWTQFHELAWPDPTFKKLAVIDLVIVAICVVELAILFARTKNKRSFLKEHWYDFLGLVPMYAESLALLRLARIFRVVRVARALRLVFAGRRILRTFEFIGRVVKKSGLGYSISVFGAVVIVMATAFWFGEHERNPHIRDFADAIWWSVTTAATVGYGDVTPATGLGRVLSIGLMLFGLGFMGVITSSLSAALMFVANHEGAVEEVIEEERPALSAELAALAELYTQGALDAAEFSAAKRKLLIVDAPAASRRERG
jgi:voltage-gated potassium channel